MYNQVFSIFRVNVNVFVFNFWGEGFVTDDYFAMEKAPFHTRVPSNGVHYRYNLIIIGPALIAYSLEALKRVTICREYVIGIF